MSFDYLTSTTPGDYFNFTFHMSKKLTGKISCVSLRRNILYVYNEDEHRWVNDNYKAHEIMCNMYNELLGKLELDCLEYGNKINKIANEMEKDDAIFKFMDTTQFIRRIDRPSIKSKIMGECRIYLYDKEFIEQLDKNQHLLGFTNGVLDLKTGEFRSGCYTDYISMTTGYDYVEYSDAELAPLESYLCNVWPDTKCRDKTLKQMATFLTIKKQKHVNVWIGGSGIEIANLLCQSMGEYAWSLADEILETPMTIKEYRRKTSNKRRM